MQLIVSEPIGTIAEAWTEIPQSTAVTFGAAETVSRPFRPQLPA
jgi:hypothetical protein